MHMQDDGNSEDGVEAVELRRPKSEDGEYEYLSQQVVQDAAGKLEPLLAEEATPTTPSSCSGRGGQGGRRGSWQSVEEPDLTAWEVHAVHAAL